MLELGPIEQNLAKQAMRLEGKLPDRIANAPELKPGLELYLEAFLELESERTNNGYGPSAIPWRSVAEYATFFEFSEEQRDDLFYFIRSLDGEYLKKAYAKIKASKPKAGKGKGR